MLLSAIVLVAAVHTVSGLSGGAPLQACGTLTPQHGGNVPQVTTSPHIVNLSDFDSMFNETLNATLLYYIPDTLYSSMLLATYILKYNYHNWYTKYFCLVTLEATGMGQFSDAFRGFLLQGRAYADDSVVGTFMPPPPGALYRLSSCERSDVSHQHSL